MVQLLQLSLLLEHGALLADFRLKFAQSLTLLIKRDLNLLGLHLRQGLLVKFHNFSTKLFLLKLESVLLLEDITTFAQALLVLELLEVLEAVIFAELAASVGALLLHCLIDGSDLCASFADLLLAVSHVFLLFLQLEAQFFELDRGVLLLLSQLLLSLRPETDLVAHLRVVLLQLSMFALQVIAFLELSLALFVDL